MQRGLKAPSIAKRSSLAGAQVNTHTHPAQHLSKPLHHHNHLLIMFPSKKIAQPLHNTYSHMPNISNLT
jgi:hypothetical protein